METNIQIDAGAKLKNNGFCLVKSVSDSGVNQLLSSLGVIMHSNLVKEDPLNTRLLTSNRFMSVHSDHYLADYVAWHCLEPATAGGESLALDGLTLINMFFSPKDRRALSGLEIRCHKIFPNDQDSYPFLELSREVAVKIFYAEWMETTPKSEQQKTLFSKFKYLLSEAYPISLLLGSGDLLIVDNNRMLHGRNAFDSNTGRCLKRFWLKSF